MSEEADRLAAAVLTVTAGTRILPMTQDERDRLVVLACAYEDAAQAAKEKETSP